MPTINTKTRLTVKPFKDNFKRPRSTCESDRRKLRNDIYSTQKWQNLRKAKLMEMPLCECCLVGGRYVPAQVVHHRDSFTNYDNPEVRRVKAFDGGNLVSLCSKCHNALHGILSKEGRTTRGETPEQIYNIIQNGCSEERLN